MESDISELIYELKNDKKFYETWKSNIAMAFKDEYRLHKPKSGRKNMTALDIHAISNKAADRFLKLFCAPIKKPGEK